MDFFNEVFHHIPRQGPGSKEATIKAYEIIKNHLSDDPIVLDIGCGSGASTLTLAELGMQNIIAIDNDKNYLEILENKAEQEGFLGSIDTLEADMNDIPFKEEAFDLIWGEGSIFIMGFEKGLEEWRKYLAPQGVLAVTDISWIKDDIPGDLWSFWNFEYEQIDFIEECKKKARAKGYEVIDSFILPAECWNENYYCPMKQRIALLAETHSENPEFKELQEFINHEIEMYEKYSEFYSYVFYLLRKV